MAALHLHPAGSPGPIIFAVPGLVLATAFVTVPFVAREPGPWGNSGRVYVVSGHIAGQTDTMPLRIEKLFQEYNLPGSFPGASPAGHPQMRPPLGDFAFA